MEHQTFGQWVVRPSDPAYYIEDCRISAVKEIGLAAGPKKDHLFCAIHKANEIGGAQAERILEKTSEKNIHFASKKLKKKVKQLFHQ